MRQRWHFHYAINIIHCLKQTNLGNCRVWSRLHNDIMRENMSRVWRQSVREQWLMLMSRHPVYPGIDRVTCNLCRIPQNSMRQSQKHHHGPQIINLCVHRMGKNAGDTMNIHTFMAHWKRNVPWERRSLNIHGFQAFVYFAPSSEISQLRGFMHLFIIYAFRSRFSKFDPGWRFRNKSAPQTGGHMGWGHKGSWRDMGILLMSNSSSTTQHLIMNMLTICFN